MVPGRPHNHFSLSCALCEYTWFQGFLRSKWTTQTLTMLRMTCYWGLDMSQRMTKPIKWHVRKAKTQISSGIRPVWSESSLTAWRKLWSLATHWAHSKESQTGRKSRLIWVFVWRTCALYALFVNKSENNMSWREKITCYCSFDILWKNVFFF